MIEVFEYEALNSITGGISLSGALINSFTTGIKVVLDLGRNLGTAVRRAIAGKLCSL